LPHITIEYSANPISKIEIERLVEKVRIAAAAPRSNSAVAHSVRCGATSTGWPTGCRATPCLVVLHRPRTVEQRKKLARPSRSLLQASRPAVQDHGIALRSKPAPDHELPTAETTCTTGCARRDAETFRLLVTTAYIVRCTMGGIHLPPTLVCIQLTSRVGRRPIAPGEKTEEAMSNSKRRPLNGTA
jgi:hypothetical protein